VTTRPEPLPPWLAWPVRVVAVIVVVPFRLAWDLLVLVAGFLWRHVGQPVSAFVYAYLLRPLGYAFYYAVWVPLDYLLVRLLWPPVAWLAKHVLVPLCTALWRATVWLFRLIGPALTLTMRLLYRYLLRPIGLAIAWLWRWVVVPVAQVVAWAWNHSVVLLWRYLVVIPVRWTGRTFVTPTARWLHRAILRPLLETSRRVLAGVGLR